MAFICTIKLLFLQWLFKIQVLVKSKRWKREIKDVKIKTLRPEMPEEWKLGITCYY